MRRLRVQLTLALGLLGALVVTWGAALLALAHDAAERRVALGATAALAITVLALASLLWFSVSVPVAGLRRASSRLAGGDLATPVHLPHAPGELQAVASDLDAVRLRLAGQVQALRRLHELVARYYQQAERAAREARAALDTVTEGLVLTDPEGRVTAMNRAAEQLCGWTEAEARGRPHAEVLPLVDEHGRPVPPGERWLGCALRAGEPRCDQGAKLELVARDGRRLPVACSAAPVLSAAGDVIGGVGVARDVSREREVDEMKSSLIATVSHELRTPLTLIRGFAELLALRELPAERRRVALEEILEASRRLSRLIDDLLSASRMESGRLVLNPRPLDVAALVERALSPFRAMAGAHVFRAELERDLPMVWGDPDKVEQVLINLVGNAVKYSPRGGEVLVAVRRDGEFVEVRVRDQGIGISPGEMAHLFEKFYRADRDEVRCVGGTGLGLYITRRLVEMHGGSVWAESRPGEGSTFFFTLPTREEAVTNPKGRDRA